jgi:hypothetical protein
VAVLSAPAASIAYVHEADKVDIDAEVAVHLAVVRAAAHIAVNIVQQIVAAASAFAADAVDVAFDIETDDS